MKTIWTEGKLGSAGFAIAVIGFGALLGALGYADSEQPEEAQAPPGPDDRAGR